MIINGVLLPDPDKVDVDKEYVGYSARALDGTLHVANISIKRVLNFAFKGISKEDYRTLVGFLKQPVVVEIDDLILKGVLDDLKEEKLTPSGSYWKVDCVVREA